MKQTLSLIFLVICFNAYSQDPDPVKKFRDVSPFGYSEYVEIDLGNAKMLLISGQVSTDKDGNTVGEGDFAKQAELVFTKIKSIVERSGGKMKDVVRLNYYMADMTDLAKLREIRARFINLANPPVSSAIEVKRLFKEDILIEVDATAVIPK